MLLFPQLTLESNCGKSTHSTAWPRSRYFTKIKGWPLLPKDLLPGVGAAPLGLDVPPRGLQEERQSHTALPGPFLVHWLISSISTAEPIPSVPAGPLGAQDGTGGVLGCSSGVFPPLQSPAVHPGRLPPLHQLCE